MGCLKLDIPSNKISVLNVVHRVDLKQVEKSASCIAYGARFYDPSIGRFSSIDRFAEKYNSMTPYQYGANSPINFIDINGDSIQYANAQIQAYVETYTSPTITKSNGKVKKNKNYDPEFASIIQELEGSNLMFNFTDDGSGMGANTLGQVTAQGDGHNIDVAVPDHSGTSKSSGQDLAGGRGAILAEETYHAAQVSRGELVEAKGGFRGTSKLSLIGAEIDAKIWSSNRAMSSTRTTIQGARAPTMMGLIKSTKGNRKDVFNILTKPTTRTITRASGGTMTITYPKTYDPK